MYRDEWLNVIEFLHPIDVLASLIGVTWEIQELVGKLFVNLEENSIRIKLFNSEHDDEENNEIRLVGNSKYFIRLYLLELALRLGNENPEEEHSNIWKILDESQLKMLGFYRCMFSPECSNENNENEFRYINYIIIGNRGIGKRTLYETISSGEFKDHGFWNHNVDFFIRKFQIPGELETKHCIWDCARRERTLSTGLVKLSSRAVNYFLVCFPMNNPLIFEEVDKWFSAIKESSPNSNLGIIVGLHPNTEKNGSSVNFLDAVKKAFTFGKSIFVEVISKEMKNVYVPFWFIQLQFTYFQSHPPQEYISKEIPNSPEKSTCYLL